MQGGILRAMPALVPLIVAVLVAAPEAPPKLTAGIELYHAGDLKGSLPLLLEALDAGGTKQRATARLYIGLIQHRTGNARDADASFRHALELWPQIRPPRGTPRATQEAFDQVLREVAPPRDAKTRREKRRSTRSLHPEVLEPVEGDGAVSNHEWDVDQPANDEETIGTVETVPAPVSTGLPVAGWIAGGAGLAALIAGTTLLIISGVTGKRALDQPDKDHAADLYGTAGAEHKAALASFGAAGVLFGVTALTVTF